MKKICVFTIASLIAFNFVAYGADSDNNGELLIKSGITISADDDIQGNKVQKDTEDPLNWQDSGRLTKTPKPKPQPQAAPASESEEPQCYYVTSQATSIRSTPSFMADRIGIYKFGTLVCAHNRIGEWINTGTGWVNTKFLSEKKPGGQSEDAEKQAAAAAPVLKPKQQEEQAVKAPEKEIPAPKEQPKARIFKYVAGGKVNIRIRPTTDSVQVGQYEKNERVEVLETIPGWVRTDKGWVSSDYISDSQPVEKTVEKPKIIKCLYVSYKKANIRKSPERSAKLLGEYDNGDKVCLYETKKDWGRSDKGWVNLYNLDDKKCYFVDAKTLNVRKKPDSDSKIVQILKRGNKVCEYDRKNGWVNTGKGWVSGDYLK